MSARRHPLVEPVGFGPPLPAAEREAQIAELERSGFVVLRPAPDVLVLDVLFPLVVPSVANLREHWRVARKRVKAQRETTELHMRASLARASATRGYAPPLRIRITRVATRPIKDGHDNLRSACKAIVDGVALALGVDDGAPGLTWEYRQATAWRNADLRSPEYGKTIPPSVRVEIWRR